MRRFALPLAAVAVIAVVVIGLIQASGGEDPERLPRFDLDQALADLKGAPAPLAALHAQQSELLDGGTKAVQARLKELRGYPVVVNKWGSWCGPCREEFPIFQRVATDRGKEIAFLGIDVIDNETQARKFLGDFPVPYPSYRDPRGDVSQVLGMPGGAPLTLFLDEEGKTMYVSAGRYKSVADLERDIDRYL